MISVLVNPSSTLYQDESLPSCQACTYYIPAFQQDTDLYSSSHRSGTPHPRMPTGALPDLSLCHSLPTQAIHSWGAGPLDPLKVVLLNHHQAGPVFSACANASIEASSYLFREACPSPFSFLDPCCQCCFLRHICWALHHK